MKYNYFHASLQNASLGLTSISNENLLVPGNWVSKILPHWKKSGLVLCNVTNQTPKIEMSFPILLFVSNAVAEFGETKQWYYFDTQRLLTRDIKVLDYAMNMTLELRRTISKRQNTISEQDADYKAHSDISHFVSRPAILSLKMKDIFLQLIRQLQRRLQSLNSTVN